MVWHKELEEEEEGKVEGGKLLSNLLREGKEAVEVGNSSSSKAAVEQRQILEETCKLTSHPATWVTSPSRLPLWGQKGRRSTWQL